ncbi:VRR-NUC domain-containing protein [Clostridioides difficile]
MLESKIEKRLKKEIELLGGKAMKFISPGEAGVPDRIVLLPEGHVIFVELKAPGKKLRKLQQYKMLELRELGFKVKCVSTLKEIDDFIKEVKGWNLNHIHTKNTQLEKL